MSKPDYWEAGSAGQAFMGIRYIASEAVRAARAALDLGSTKEELVPLFKRHISKDLPQVAKDNLKAAIPLAIQFMVDNPDAGAVVWLENGRWDWAPWIEPARAAIAKATGESQ